jgi:uncharacterized protein YdaU (DUF1376 family)
MNYYERHLGDYARDTAHLSMMEHGAYNLLLDRYYATEQGIPADQVHRLARARTREERAAVDAVLQEFFTLQEGVWINKRATQEILKAQGRIQAAQQNGKRGGRPKKTEEKPTGFVPGSNSETQTKAHQTPDTIHQTEIPPSSPPTPSGKVCMALREAGLSGVNPGHPDLLALLEAGATEEELLGAARTAVDRGKASFAYVLAMLKRQRQEAAAMASSLHRGVLPRNLTAAEQRVLQAVPSLAAPHLRPVIPTPLEAFHAATVAAPLALG